MLSTFFLGVLSFFQKVQFKYIYISVGIYLGLLWIFYAIWVWKDLEGRFKSSIFRFIIWLPVSITFILGYVLYILIRPPKKDEDSYWTELEKRYLVYETFGMKECEVCGYNLRPEFMQCPDCGNVLREQCKNCNHTIEKDWKICPYCGRVHIKEEEAKVGQRRLSLGAAFIQGIKSVGTDIKTLTFKVNETTKSVPKQGNILKQIKTLLFIEEKTSSKKEV